jgi:Regulator of G protein signaling domain
LVVGEIDKKKKRESIFQESGNFFVEKKKMSISEDNESVRTNLTSPTADNDSDDDATSASSKLNENESENESSNENDEYEDSLGSWSTESMSSNEAAAAAPVKIEGAVFGLGFSADTSSTLSTSPKNYENQQQNKNNSGKSGASSSPANASQNQRQVQDGGRRVVKRRSSGFLCCLSSGNDRANDNDDDQDEDARARPALSDDDGDGVFEMGQVGSGDNYLAECDVPNGEFGFGDGVYFEDARAAPAIDVDKALAEYTLERVLDNQRYLNALARFAAKEFSIENIRCWQAMTSYLALESADERLALFVCIVEDFFESTSPQLVGLTDVWFPMRSLKAEVLDAGKSPAPAERDALLADADKLVRDTHSQLQTTAIRSVHSRWTMSPDFRHFVKREFSQS